VVEGAIVRGATIRYKSSSLLDEREKLLHEKLTSPQSVALLRCSHAIEQFFSGGR
jgi:hypothetical protein